MSYNFVSCGTKEISFLDDNLVKYFETTGKMGGYTAYINEADAAPVLAGKRMAEVSLIGKCEYNVMSAGTHFELEAFVCNTNVNLQHLCGLALSSFMNQPQKDVLVIKNLYLGTIDDPEWVFGGTTAIVVGFAIRNEPSQHGSVSRGRLLALAKDAGNRLIFCVIDTGTDFEEGAKIRTSRMCPVEFSESSSSQIRSENIIPGIPTNALYRFDLLLHDANNFTKIHSDDQN